MPRRSFGQFDRNLLLWNQVVRNYWGHIGLEPHGAADLPPTRQRSQSGSHCRGPRSLPLDRTSPYSQRGQKGGCCGMASADCLHLPKSPSVAEGRNGRARPAQFGNLQLPLLPVFEAGRRADSKRCAISTADDRFAQRQAGLEGFGTAEPGGVRGRLSRAYPCWRNC